MKILICLDANVSLKKFNYNKALAKRLEYFAKAKGIEIKVYPLHEIQNDLKCTDRELLKIVKEMFTRLFDKVIILTYDLGFPTDKDVYVIKIPHDKRREDELATYIIKALSSIISKGGDVKNPAGDPW